MRISDQIRNWCDLCDGELIDKEYCSELYALADCIDSEMVELPRDRDGVPIHVGDTVYLDDGRKADVSRINIARDHTSIDFQTYGDGRIFFAIEPRNFTHTYPDSWERIADELEDWSEDNRVNGDSEVFDRASIFADRIRKLAEREGK